MSNRHPQIEWGVAGRPHPGESVSGDAHLVRPVGDGVLVAVIDGLGHGEGAAAASQVAIATLERCAGLPLDSLLRRCHEALLGTRGVAISLAFFSTPDSSLTWMGVGNVDATLLRADPTSVPRRQSLLLRGGVLGYELPSLKVTTHRVAPGDTLVMATDGIRSIFAEGLRAGAPPQQLAERILEEHGKGTDDALVLAARLLKGTP